MIRDRIPEIIKRDNWIPRLRILNKKEYFKEVKKKILEEAEELIEAEKKEEVINEIVDLQELIDILIGEIGLNQSQIQKQQKIKNQKRGGFKKRLFLIKTEKI